MLSFLRCWGTRVSLQGCWGRDKLEQEAWGFWCRTVSLAEGGAAWWSLEESPRLPGVISALGAPRKAAGPLPCARHCQLTGKPGSPGLAGACRNRGGATAPGLRARAPGRHTREHFLFCVSVPEGLAGGEGAGKGPGDPPLFLRCSLSSEQVCVCSPQHVEALLSLSPRGKMPAQPLTQGHHLTPHGHGQGHPPPAVSGSWLSPAAAIGDASFSLSHLLSQEEVRGIARPSSPQAGSRAGAWSTCPLGTRPMASRASRLPS